MLRFTQTNSPHWLDKRMVLVIQVFGLLQLVFWDGALSPYKWYQSHTPRPDDVEDTYSWSYVSHLTLKSFSCLGQAKCSVAILTLSL